MYPQDGGPIALLNPKKKKTGRRPYSADPQRGHYRDRCAQADACYASHGFRGGAPKAARCVARPAAQGNPRGAVQGINHLPAAPSLDSLLTHPLLLLPTHTPTPLPTSLSLPNPSLYFSLSPYSTSSVFTSPSLSPYSTSSVSRQHRRGVSQMSKRNVEDLLKHKQ